MTISRGKINDCLGMTLDFTIKGEVKITITKCVENMLLLFSEHDKFDKLLTHLQLNTYSK
jgi:hypothetical protein